METKYHLHNSSGKVIMSRHGFDSFEAEATDLGYIIVLSGFASSGWAAFDQDDNECRISTDWL